MGWQFKFPQNYLVPKNNLLNIQWLHTFFVTQYKIILEYFIWYNFQTPFGGKYKLDFPISSTSVRVADMMEGLFSSWLDTKTLKIFYLRRCHKKKTFRYQSVKIIDQIFQYTSTKQYLYFLILFNMFGILYFPYRISLHFVPF